MVEQAPAHDIGQAVISDLRKMNIYPAPECYEVWFKYRRDPKSELAQEIETRIASNEKIDADFILSLYYRHCESVDLGPVFDKYFDSVLEEVEGLKGVAMGLSDSATAFRDDVTSLSADMVGKEATKTELKSLIAALVETAAAATKRNKDLESKLSSAIENVGHLRTALEEIEQDAHTDFLTKLSNRRRFDRFLRDTIAVAEREHTPLSLIVCDIDHFKKFNDTYGHLVGDHVIKFVAEILKKNIKGQDLASRYGGEEFAVVLPNTEIKNARTLAEQMRIAIAKKRLVSRFGNRDLGSITMSFGVAEHAPGMTGEALFKSADEALYDAKTAGRNKVMVREPGGQALSA
ncbi:MAG: GGDEF domain-containing protein [Amphiplicatus sp.]